MAAPGAEASPGWSGQAQWQVLALGFGTGEAFLRTWLAWEQDPKRPDRLFYTAVEPHPSSAEHIRTLHGHGTGAQEGIGALAAQLAEQLAEQWAGLAPGVHRLAWAQGRVCLTLLVGTPTDLLPGLDTPADHVQWVDPELADLATLKAATRLCRPGTHLTTDAPVGWAGDLSTLGYQVHPSTNGALHAVYQPHWHLRRVLRAPLFTRVHTTPADVVVVGGGLSGAAVAHSLALRGCRVTVLDAADQPAAGASGLPVGLLAPHVSPDDTPLSRLTRAGVRATRARLQSLLPAGEDWAPSGVLEHRVEGKHGLPAGPAWPDTLHGSSRAATGAQLLQAGLPSGAPALWHGQAAWLRPARLVAAQLQHPLITWQGGAPVAHVARVDGAWRLTGPAGQVWAHSPQVVWATAYPTRALLAALGLELPLHALRGQVSWGPLSGLDPNTRAVLPPFPVNGHGSLVVGAPGPDNQPCWLLGSTFERGNTQTTLRSEDHQANHQRLGRLLPHLSGPMATAFAQAQGWAGVRCTVPDRLPVVGAPDPERWPGLHVSVGMGARGLTLSVLCAEVLAAEWLGEPWPVTRSLAQALLARRWVAPKP
ncbi:MAG: hypothetical protein RJA09_48 [Pseudomonadota bacterium]